MTLLDATPAALGAGSRALVLLRSRRRLDLLNPDPQAWTDDDLAAGLSCTMVEAFGIESNPLLDDPLSPNEFARWKPCPPRVSQLLFMEHFRALARGSRSSVSPTRTPGSGSASNHSATPSLRHRFWGSH